MQPVSLKIAGQWKRWFMPLIFCALLVTGIGTAAELDTESGVLRSRVYPFKHISSQQAQEFFSQLHIGKKYNPLTPEILIVTSDIGSDLVKATAIAGILDQDPAPKIEILATDSQSLPKPEAFITGLKSITIGSLIEAPPKGSVNPAIIDVHDHKLIAIASEDILNDIKAAFQAWEKENPPSIPEKAAAAVLPQAPEEPALSPVLPVVIEPAEAPMEPNLPPLVGEPNTLARPAVEATASTGSIEEVAEQLFETQFMADANTLSETAPTELTEPITEPNEPAAETPDESTEDFLSEGLLQELAAAGQKAEIEQAPDETTVAETTEAISPEPTEAQPAAADANEPVQEEVPEEDPMKILQALMAQARAEEAEEEKEAVQEPQAQPQDAQAEEPSSPVEPADSVQTELEQLRQKLAELEAKAAEAAIPAADPAVESKIQTATTVQTEPQLDAKLAEKDLVTMDLPQEVELESLVDLVGKQLGLNYMYDPAILKNQKVQLKVHGGKIKVKDVYSLLESVLKLKGFVMSRNNQLVTIVKAANASQAYKQVDPVIRTPGEPIEAGNVIVSTLFQLTYTSTASAKKMLVSLNLGMTDGFQEIPETGTLLVTDYAYRMGRIEEVLSIIDKPGEKKEYKFRTLKYMTPSEMVPKLQELAGKMQDVSLQINAPAAPAAPTTRTITTRDPRTGETVKREVPITTPTRTPAAAAPKAATPDTVFIDTDNRTNRILMAGKPGQIALINELIDSLDVPQYDLRFVREYLIQNVEAQEIVDAINELGLASVSATASSTTSAVRRTPTSSRTPTPAPAASSAAGGADQPYISIRAASNSLLVNATAEQHGVIELVIAYVDQVQKDQRTIRQYEIQYVDTQEIMDTLTDLGIIASQTTSTYGSSTSRSTSSSSRPTAARTAAPGAAETVAAVSLPTTEGGSEKEITAEQPQISVLETTNSLLVYATPRQHDAIALVIAYADQTPETTTTPYVVYALENHDPLILSEIMTRLIQETVEEVGKTSTSQDKIQTRPTGQTGGSTVPTLEEQKIRIIPDEMSYSLIVYANKRNQQWIAELIRELDEYRPQVLLDLTLVEVSKLDEFQFDLDLVAKTYHTGTGDSGDYTFLRHGVDSGGDALPATGASLLDPIGFSDQRYAHGQISGGEITGFFNSSMIQGLLQTMQKKNYGRILNRPKLLVNDNEEGTITLEQVTYREITTTSYYGTENAIPTESVDYQDYSAGITMTIKPHISKGDQLRLEIILNRSDFNIQEGDDPSLPPNTITSDVTTVVTVPDKNTIILGGLERINQSKGGTKVPILGDIPIVGGLFRSIGNTDDQRKTYIFVRANILRPGQDNLDLKDVSQRDRIQFEKMESEMQEYQDWPGIDPTPMDPVKVLEDDFVMISASEADVTLHNDTPEDDAVDTDAAVTEDDEVDEYLQVIRRKLKEMDEAKLTAEVK